MRSENRLVRCDKARNWTSAMLRTGLTATVAMLAFGLVDTVGQMLYARHFCADCYPAEWLGGLYGALAAAAPFAHWVAGSVAPKKKGRHLPMSLSLLAGVGAAVVIIPALVGLDMFSHAIAYGFQRPVDAPPALMISSKPMPVEISLRLAADSSENQERGAGKSNNVVPMASPTPEKSRASSPSKNPLQGPNHGQAEAKGLPPGIPMKLVGPTMMLGSAGNVASPKGQCGREASPLVIALFFGALFSCFAGADSRPRGKGTSGATVFLNRTSLHPLYTARLIRAYLGASNKSRYGDTRGVSEVVAGDDISQERYWVQPEKLYYSSGAPLHLVNMTLNQTIGGESQIERRDRKGLGMAVGPSGLSVGVRHHAVYQKTSDTQTIMVETFPHPVEGAFRVFDYKDYSVKSLDPIAEFKGERLSLGNWTGLSGAAASTAMGFRTSLGVSLITAFFNVRLGYWWDSGIERHASGKRWAAKIGGCISRYLPVQGYLIDEFLARFHGTTRQLWYLSDGGNFENLGAYELIRRRLPLMIVVDAGADPDYDFDDVAGLVRKARLDFNAEIEFLEANQIKAELKAALEIEIENEALKWYGPLEQLRRGNRADEPAPPPATERNVFFKSSKTARYSLKHAAFARVRYLDDDAVSFLILIKPTLVGDEPTDVIQYHSSHPSFPHESTADQFFDEAQWEAYRRLGQHIVEKIFAMTDEGGFLPASKQVQSLWYWRW
ncbi:MAG: hypothetical protein ACLQU2_12710 [Candidatus Binataceae bacterium]